MKFAVRSICILLVGVLLSGFFGVPAESQTMSFGDGDELVRLVIDDPVAAELAAERVGEAEVVVDTDLFATVEVPKGRASELVNAAYSSGAGRVEVERYAQKLDVFPTDPYYGRILGLEQMSMPRAWTVTKGSSSTVIAIIDTGVATVSELSGRVLPGYSLIPGESARVTPNDGKDDGHGTLSAVVAAGSMNNGVGNVGSCPLCTILPVRVFAQGSGEAAYSDIAAGIIWAADNGADIISMSLGGSVTTVELQNAVAYANGKGVLLVAAAGNQASSAPFYPASYPEVLGVAGVNTDRVLYDWSNRGTTVDFAAHGCNYAQNDESAVEIFCGTSSATPLLAGALALYHTQNPTKTPAQIRSAAAQTRTFVSGISGGTIDAALLLGVSSVGTLADIVGASPGRVVATGTINTGLSASVRIFLSTGETIGGSAASGGFSVAADTPRGGPLDVCAEATPTGSFDGVLLGCRTLNFPSGNPIGNVDSVIQFGPGKVQVNGWTIDPDTTNANDVHFYVDGRYAGAVTANIVRSDVGAVYAAYGSAHGYSALLSPTSGFHQVCAYAINRGVGNTNPLLGCRNVVVNSGNPFGNYESAAQVGPQKVRVSGWAFDFDSVNPIDIHVYVDGRWGGAGSANTSRLDVGRAFPGYGNNHGFTMDLTMMAGFHNVCVYAINVGSGNSNPLLGCRSITVGGGNPIGNYEGITKVDASNTRISGWALDFDTVNPITLHVYVNGVFVAAPLANTLRADVGRAFVGYGDNHGFNVSVRASSGSDVCVFAINSGPGNMNSFLGCRKAP